MNTTKPKKKYTLLKIIATASAVTIVLGLISTPLKTVEYNVSAAVSEPVRIIQLSDLHSCYYGKDMKNLTNEIDKNQPDIIVLTGDIYDDEMDNENTRILLKYIAKKYPCYYVAGNHELYSSRWSEYKTEAEAFGITVIEGDTVQLGDIAICGAAPAADGSFDHEDSIEKCSKACAEDPDKFCVLLNHYPEQIDLCRSYNCFDLILCGHAHGGQWRIPFLINGLVAPGQGLFPKYAGGRYDFSDCTMIVSRGLSRENIPVPRIFNNPELVIVNITPKENKDKQ